jgi:hypothetical protein
VGPYLLRKVCGRRQPALSRLTGPNLS